MNLCGDQWIPVVFSAGKTGKLSLEEIFSRAEEVVDLVVSPPQRVALTRLLICITQAALDGPEDRSAWKACRTDIINYSLAYLSKYRDRFELFGGESPFLQLPNVEDTGNAPVDKLDFELASGHGSTLFDREALAGGRLHDSGEMALLLLTYQCFSPGGTIGTTSWNGKTTSRYSKQAPCLEGSPLHTIIIGENLLETIHLNLVNRHQLAHLGIDFGRPVWEDCPEELDTVTDVITGSYLGRLVPVSRAIVFKQGSTVCTLAEGVIYSKLPAYRDPMLTVTVREVKKKQLPFYLRCVPGRHAWRDLGSILTLSRTMDSNGGPLALENLTALGDTAVFNIWTGGLATDQAKVLDSIEWSCSLRSELLGEGALTKYRQGVRDAELGEYRLRDAIRAYSDQMKIGASAGKTSIMDKAKVIYWGGLDARNEVLMECASNDKLPLESWWKLIQREAFKAYSRLCPHWTPRQIQAFEVGRKKLWVSLRPRDKHGKKEDKAKKGVR